MASVRPASARYNIRASINPGLADRHTFAAPRSFCARRARSLSLARKSRRRRNEHFGARPTLREGEHVPSGGGVLSSDRTRVPEAVVEVGARVLLVEDDPTIQNMLADALRDSGFSVGI